MGKEPKSLRLHVPVSAVPGIGWPAIPGPREATILALQQQLERSQWWPEEVLRKMQLHQLQPLLAHARKSVSFYHDRLGAIAGLRPGDLGFEAWRDIPILSRRDIQDAGSALFSNSLPKEHGPLGQIHSSGSTGRPIMVKTTRITGLFFAALNLRYHLWHERDFSAKTVKITRPRPTDGKDRPVGWVPGYRSGPMVSFDVNKTVDKQVDWLVDNKPGYLLTYPTNLQAILNHCRKTGIKFPHLKSVATMGEILTPEIRKNCKRDWGLEVSDAYSAMEVGMIAIQCPEHPHYHVQSESLLVEILDDAGKPCRPGEVGRIVVTDLHNFAMPLVRYEIGDFAEVGEPCACGRGLPVLSRILGRTRNLLLMPSGEKTWPVFSGRLTRDFPELSQFQLIQRTPERIEVMLVAKQPLSADREEALRGVLGEELLHDFDFRIIYVDDIPRSAGGKFEDFQSDI
ncbi:MAG: phenylacetate--CoA ligase family protein [Alphaproteobacteria bacterium]